ncbi:proteoglycan 3 [Pelobates cultripes]|uniref:Proteoglycan 3 n=1 Tax=Pelobates cultripes TaxID=61616 RepID=A0AAD1WQ50_PELCU|nr:proteoglycan 3 [Pelobates cultripes]
MFTFLLMLFLVGSVSAQTSGEEAEEDCDAQENTEISLLSEGNSEECQNVSVTLDKTTYPKICPGDEKCHYRFFGQCTTFSRAQRRCRRLHGNVSSIHSLCANNYIARFVRCINRHVRFVWIGVIRGGCLRRIRNVDGSKIDFTNWACGQPGHNHKLCTAINICNGKWYSFNCNARLPSICTF